MVRRSRYDPFAFEAFPHRVRVVDRHNTLVWESRLPPGTDLRSDFSSLLVYWRELGWDIEEPYLLTVFLSCGDLRWHLSISQYHD